MRRSFLPRRLLTLDALASISHQRRLSSTHEGREASTCGRNSEFHYWARPFTTSLSATKTTWRTSRLRRLQLPCPAQTWGLECVPPHQRADGPSSRCPLPGHPNFLAHLEWYSLAGPALRLPEPSRPLLRLCDDVRAAFTRHATDQTTGDPNAPKP